MYGSVADPGCLSRILIFYPSRGLGSRIQQQQQERSGEKISCITRYRYLFCSHNFHRIKKYLICVKVPSVPYRKKFDPVDKENIVPVPVPGTVPLPKIPYGIVSKLSKICVGGYGIRETRSGTNPSRIQGPKRDRIRISSTEVRCR